MSGGMKHLQGGIHMKICACCFLCAQVKQLAAYLAQREAEGEPAFHYAVATVTRWAC